MTRGDRIVYRCLAGFRYGAEVTSVQLDGTVNLAVDNGSSDPTNLTKIKLVETGKLTPGTCCEREQDGTEATT